MSELRQNPLSGQWVVYAPLRKKRPYDFHASERETAGLPERDTSCPFCPGNERMLPDIILEKPDGDGVSWMTRVVPNKYAAFESSCLEMNSENGPYAITPGYGYHEVIIESPIHNEDIPRMAPERVAAIVETYYKRYVEILADRKIMEVFIFRNHGKSAGTSLVHPHSQLIATPVVPAGIETKKKRAREYFRECKHCLFCDILRFERSSGNRILFENGSFVAFIPYAAEVPFELWIFPKAHQSDFRLISDTQKGELATMLKSVLGVLTQRLGDPDYNLLLSTFTRADRDDRSLHWHIVVRPRTTIKAGFEIGSGMAINPSFPEEDCRILKEGP
ncbi:MAG: galactose-1-phosphate uridylyltransferase [Spirochaetes bacterium]|nr:galactose-1-phosphate uridylyltransferase [Spirochaetota bacterium]